MALLPAELIRKKRFGGTHTQGEIAFLIQNYAREEIPDYQMAAWLMAVCLKGMTEQETAWLTEEMRDSGKVLDLGALGLTVDKHSTGGIGDKTSLIIAPIVAAAGVPVPMMAGRGLAHTGGTLDKLESIPGFDVNLGFDQFKKQLAQVGTAIIGQTKEICPADRKLYALRDVTGTVDSLPLICGSIMSKKLAEGMSALVLDVKFGSGAFMKSVSDSEALARALMQIARHAGKQVTALLTRMDEPLGRFIGNALEVRECLDILENRPFAGVGKGYEDTRELTLELSAHMILLGQKAANLDEARAVARGVLEDGRALAKFREMTLAQKGRLDQFTKTAKHQETVLAPTDGYFNYTDLEKIGLAGVYLGAGRAFSTDPLDHLTGIEVFRTQGEKVVRGAPLFTIYHSDPTKFKSALEVLQRGYALAEQPLPRSPLIAKVLT